MLLTQSSSKIQNGFRSVEFMHTGSKFTFKPFVNLQCSILVQDLNAAAAAVAAETVGGDGRRVGPPVGVGEAAAAPPAPHRKLLLTCCEAPTPRWGQPPSGP